MANSFAQPSYGEMTSGPNYSRLTGITYPNGRVVNYTYGAADSLEDCISRLAALSDTSATLESYTYLGLGTVVQRAHPQPNVNLSYLITGSSDGGDQYVGLDRFGRVAEQRWDKAGAATDRFQYTYDRDSNRLTKTLPLQASKNESYGYDALNQLTSFSQGASHTQSWTLDALGNWATFTNDAMSQARDHNRQNQATAVAGNPLSFDNNGNTLTTENGRALSYDAWNRLASATGGGSSVTFRYDALNRRLTEAVVGGTTTHLYYSAGWQVLEERLGASTAAQAQYVWSAVYLDALVERDRDANGVPGDGPRGDGLEERLYAQQDANYNVTALVDAGGNVVLRLVYDPYGAVTLLTPTWGTPGSTQYAWAYLHQGGRFESVSALYHFRNRDYSATLGRWVQRDPIEFTAGDPNLYRYVGNNPTNSADPTGLQEKPPEGKLKPFLPPVDISLPDKALGKFGVVVFEPKDPKSANSVVAQFDWEAETFKKAFDFINKSKSLEGNPIDHLNWYQIFRFKDKAPEGFQPDKWYIDPPAGGVKVGGKLKTWADDLPWYWDEKEIPADFKGEQIVPWTKERYFYTNYIDDANHRCTFNDSPKWAPYTMEFKTWLVGIGKKEPVFLYGWSWSVTTTEKKVDEKTVLDIELRPGKYIDKPPSKEEFQDLVGPQGFKLK